MASLRCFYHQQDDIKENKEVIFLHTLVTCMLNFKLRRCGEPYLSPLHNLGKKKLLLEKLLRLLAQEKQTRYLKA